MTEGRALVREMYSKVMGVSDLDWSEIAEQSACSRFPHIADLYNPDRDRANHGKASNWRA